MNKLDQAKINSKVPRKDTELFEYVGERKKLTKVKILDVLFDGKKVAEYVDERQRLKLALEHLLISHGYELLDNETKSILDTLRQVLVINPTKDYTSVNLSEGFITKNTPITGKIVEATPEMTNIENGCYYIVNNKPVLDEVRMQQKILLEEE